MRNRRICLAAVLCLLAALLTGCAAGNATFNGSRTGTERSFRLDFSVLNTAFTSELTVAEGDELRVEIQCEGGKINLTIAPKGGTAIYTGSDLPTSAFRVIPETAGTYVLTVGGEKASGHVYVTAEGKPSSDGE